MSDITNKLIGESQEPRNNLSTIVANILTAKGIPPTDSAVLREIDRMDINDIYRVLNKDGWNFK